jgi:predicted regulator of Ras-like GTPase activity (Roadblock/LC7/MglB family)
MDLTQPLKDLVGKVPGATGAVLIDNEGEAITHFSAANQDERVRLIGAYHRIWLNDCVKLTQQMRLGKLDHLIQRYETGIVAVKALKDNYALVLIGEREMYLGQGLFHLEAIGRLINEDL